MLVVMRKDATAEQIRGVVEAIEARGYKGHPIPGAQRTAIGITGNRGALEAPVFESLPGVLEVIPVSHAYKLVSREVKPETSVVEIGGVAVGGNALVVTAGPCAVESLEQTLIVARAVKSAGAHLLPVKIDGVVRGINVGFKCTLAFIIAIGTVAGAWEGDLHGLPAMAVSQDVYEDINYSLNDNGGMP